MKTILLAAAAAATLAGSALAADLPVGPVMKGAVPARVMTWTGCYVGAGGGYGMYNQDVGAGTGSDFTDSLTLGGRGWFGTVQGGCDYQVTPNIVIGAFGDYDFASIKGHLVLVDEKLSSSWAAGGRAGWVALPNLLVYAAGGYTQARFDGIGLGGGASIPATTYDGWFLGTGYEYGIGFMPGLFWKTEYRFADYQNKTIGILSDGTFTSHKYVQTVRSELVYRFNWSR